MKVTWAEERWQEDQGVKSNRHNNELYRGFGDDTDVQTSTLQSGTEQGKEMAFEHKWPWDIKQANKQKRQMLRLDYRVSESKNLQEWRPQQVLFIFNLSRRRTSIKQAQTQSELLIQYTNGQICDFGKDR